MRSLFICFLIAFQLPLSTYAQQTIMYGLAKKTAAVKEVSLATVDPVSGAVSILSNPYLTNHINFGGSTLDYVNGLYWYFSPGTAANYLTSAAVTNGNLSINTPLSYPPGCTFSCIHFNCNDSLLYGMYLCNGILKFAKIDPNTGAVTLLSANSLGAGVPTDYTYDKTNAVFYFVLGAEIKGVDMTNGSLVSTTPILLPAGDYFSNIDYNCVDSTLYGTIRNTSGLRFGKISLSTGIVTVLSSSNFTSSVMGNGGHVLDGQTGYYHYSSTTAIYTIDISNGTVLNTANLTYSLPGTYGLYYINKEMPCACAGPASAPETSVSDPFEIFPNPFRNEISIRNHDNNPSEIILYDIALRNLLQQQFSNTATLNTEHLAPGIYYYEVRNQYGLLKQGKVVKD
jgi:hypothetical protein